MIRLSSGHSIFSVGYRVAIWPHGSVGCISTCDALRIGSPTRARQFISFTQMIYLLHNEHIPSRLTAYGVDPRNGNGPGSDHADIPRCNTRDEGKGSRENSAQRKAKPLPPRRSPARVPKGLVMPENYVSQESAFSHGPKRDCGTNPRTNSPSSNELARRPEADMHRSSGASVAQRRCRACPPS
jgi:hypothetical protein